MKILERQDIVLIISIELTNPNIGKHSPPDSFLELLLKLYLFVYFE